MGGRDGPCCDVEGTPRSCLEICFQFFCRTCSDLCVDIWLRWVEDGGGESVGWMCYDGG